MADRPTIAMLGGTGSLGSGLAVRLARAGYRVLIGSRDAQRAQAHACDLADLADSRGIDGMVYRDAAAAADLVILAIPHAVQKEMAAAVRDALAGKILVDATVPLVPPKVSRVQLPPEGSAAVALQSLLGPDVRVVSALQNVGAHHLLGVDERIDCDVLVSGDDAGARAEVISLLERIGLTGWHAGPLANAAAAEAITSVLIFMNRHYKGDRGGIRITGLSRSAEAAPAEVHRGGRVERKALA